MFIFKSIQDLKMLDSRPKKPHRKRAKPDKTKNPELKPAKADSET
jgi:hypothetical protein